jgi:hypothetical protein
VAHVEHSGGADLHRGGRRHGRGNAAGVSVDRQRRGVFNDRRTRRISLRRLKVQTLGNAETPSGRRAHPKGDPSPGAWCVPKAPEPRHGHTANRTWVATAQLVEPLFVHQHSKHLDAYLAFRRRSDELDLFIASLERLNKL